jgi:hypothetical protein
MRRRARRLGALALAAACAVVGGLAAADSPRSEYELKAAFLLNFARLVEWPASSFPEKNGDVVLCVIGRDLYDATRSENLENQRVGDRRVRVVQISDPDDVTECHVAFLCATHRSRDDEVIEASRGGGVLTVGESPGFARSGGVINFYQEEKKIRFEINQQAAQRAGLKISSRLLRLARLVPDEGDRR